MHQLICLLSDQRMQNVIPLFQRGLHYDRIILIASGDNGKIIPRYFDIYNDICKALSKSRDWILLKGPVDPMDPQSTCNLCRQTIEAGAGNDFTINFTGGTKPMSIGAYLAGIQAKVPLLYVDTQKEQIFRYGPEGASIMPFDLERITVRQVLELHHRVIDEKRTASHELRSNELLLEKEIYSHRPDSFRSMLFLHSLLRGAVSSLDREQGIPYKTARIAPWLLEALERIGWLRRQEDTIWFHAKAVEQINGLWLERYVYTALQNHGHFMDVSANIQIAEIENEIDVSCTLNGKLAIIECKSGGMNGQATLNRLRALKDSMAGTFGKSFLVTCRNQKNLGRVFLNRAHEYVSRIIGLEELERVEEIVYQDMARRQR